MPSPITLNAARVAACLVVLGAALGLASCGEKQEPPAPEQLSVAELEAEADAICATAREETLAAIEQDPSTPEENAALLEELISISESELTDLAALQPPESAEQDLDRYLQARVETIELQQEALQAARREDALAFAEAQAAVAEGQVERTRLAQQAGLSECSRPTPATPDEGDVEGSTDATAPPSEDSAGGDGGGGTP